MNGYIEDRGSKGCEHNSTQARFEGDDDDDDSYDFAPAAWAFQLRLTHFWSIQDATFPN